MAANIVSLPKSICSSWRFVLISILDIDSIYLGTRLNFSPSQIPSAQPSILIVLASTAPFLGTCYWSPSMATISTLRASF